MRFIAAHMRLLVCKTEGSVIEQILMKKDKAADSEGPTQAPYLPWLLVNTDHLLGEIKSKLRAQSGISA